MTSLLARLPHPSRRTTRPGDHFDRRLLAPMVLGSVLNPVNSSMIAVALVPIGVAFGAPPSSTAWLISSLYLATAVGQPVVGRLVDAFGPRPLFLAGTALTGVAGVLGALAPSLGVLVVARVLLGVGTCAGYPAAMYLIRAEARRTGQESPSGVLTVLAVANQTIAVVGPTLGGLLIGLGGWRVTFSVNVPLSLACLLLGGLRLPRHVAADPSQDVADGEEPAGALRANLDLPGIALFATMLSSLMLFVMRPQAGHWYLLVAMVLTGCGLVARELRAGVPFIDLRVLAGNVPLLATYARTLLAYVASYAFLYGFTQWLEESRGLSPSGAGLLLLPLFATAIVVSTTTGRRPEVRAKLVVGSAVQVVACALLLVVHGHSAIWLLAGVAVVTGVPQGLIGLANQNALFHQADPARMGSSAGLLRTFMYLGAIVAAAANGAFLRDGASTVGLHHLALFLLPVSVVLLALSTLDRSLRSGRRRPSSPIEA